MEFLVTRQSRLETTMRFRCGPTWEEKRAAREKWHEWFAWYPVRVRGGECAWLETVMRCCTPISGIFNRKKCVVTYNSKVQPGPSLREAERGPRLEPLVGPQE